MIFLFSNCLNISYYFFLQYSNVSNNVVSKEIFGIHPVDSLVIGSHVRPDCIRVADASRARVVTGEEQARLAARGADPLNGHRIFWCIGGGRRTGSRRGVGACGRQRGARGRRRAVSI